MEQMLEGVEAVKIVGTSPRTIRASVRRGELPCYKLGRRITFDRADLEAFLRKDRVEARGVSVRVQP